RMLSAYHRKDVARDDILDALVALVTATLELRTLPEVAEVDTEGLPMEIVYSPGETKALMSRNRSDDWRDTELASRFTVRDYEDPKAREDRASIADAVRRRFKERYLDSIFRDPRPHGFTVMAVCCLMIEALESFRQGWPDTRWKSQEAFQSFFDAH